MKDDVKVLVRVVETSNPTLLMQIIEATNSQTKVTSRDLHSNDHLQKLIEQHLAAKGYFYEARKNKYSGKDTTKRVDAELAAQAFYAIFFEQPALAKDKKKLLFGEIYDNLFNEKTNPDEILYAYRLLKLVQKLNNDKELNEKYTFLKDAALHIAALLHVRSKKENGKPLDFDKEDEAKKLYSTAVKALAVLVKERSEEEGDKYEHRRTFKDVETYGRTIEILESNTASPKRKK